MICCKQLDLSLHEFEKSAIIPRQTKVRHWQTNEAIHY